LAKEEVLAAEQRDKLNEFNTKFSQYLPSFDVHVVAQHLLFLRATHEMFTSIEDPFFTVDPKSSRRIFPTAATQVFLAKAVYRFEVWIDKVLSQKGSNLPLDDCEVPPLDVLAILHSYRLAPWIYDEDVALRFPHLRRVGVFPLGHIARNVDSKTGHYQPLPSQIRNWENLTKLPFNIYTMDPTIPIVCPACDNTLTVPWVLGPAPFDCRHGFAETAFTANCPNCSLLINHDVLATAKFVRDLIACQEIDDRVLAGTLISGIGTEQLETARVIAAEVRKTLGDPRANLGDQLSWSMETVASRIKNDPDSKIQKSKISHLLRPYGQSTPFSTDLAYKSLLQADFASLARSKGHFDEDFSPDSWVSAAIRTYRLFIKLITMPRVPNVYPTYAVDLVWHTHMLCPDYRDQIIDMVGVFVDHRSVDEVAPTADVFNANRDAWKTLLDAAGVPSLEVESDSIFKNKHSESDVLSAPSDGDASSGSGSGGSSASASQALRGESILVQLPNKSGVVTKGVPTQFISPSELKVLLE
jgi:hypothetical protein